MEEFKLSPDEEENAFVSKSVDLFLNLNTKDHGYAWVVLAGMFFTNVITAGYHKSFGLIYTAIYELYPETSVTMAGTMMGLLTGCRTIFAPVTGALGIMIGIRLSMFIGTTICVVALLASFYATSAFQLAITLGAMIGFGFCMIESCHVVILSHYFEQRLAMANAIRVAGLPFGGAIFPLILTPLLYFYGLRLTFIMLAAITMHLYVFSALIRPYELSLRIQGIRVVDKLFTGKEIQNEYSKNENYLSSDDMKSKKRNALNQMINQNLPTKNNKKKPLEFSYLKNHVYLLFIYMTAGMSLAIPMANYNAVIYAKTILDFSLYEISTMLCVQSILDVFIRLFLGWLNNKKLWKMSQGFMFCLFISGIGCSLIPLSTDFWTLMAYLTIFSLGSNSFHTLVNVILTNQFGKESISSTWGFVRMTQGIFNFISPPLIGYIVDASGNYTLSFIVMGFGMFFACFMVFMEPYVIKLNNSDIVIT